MGDVISTHRQHDRLCLDQKNESPIFVSIVRPPRYQGSDRCTAHHRIYPLWSWVGDLRTLSSSRDRITHHCGPRSDHLRHLAHRFYASDSLSLSTTMTTIPLIRAPEFAEIYPTLSRESIIDVREEDEYALVHLTHSTLSPLSQGIPEISVREEPLYILCRSGARSAQVTMELVAR